MEIKIRSIEHNGKVPDLPRRASAGSAGVDLQAMIDAPITLEPQKLYRVPTGIAMELPEGYVGLVYARSGLGVKHGIALGNDITRCGNEKWSDPAMARWIEHAVYWAEKFGK